MNKKTIITNTAVFIFVLVFVLAFKAIFGANNKVIGVTTIVAVFMLLSRDFTGEPLKNTAKFIFINLLTGIGAAIAVKNMWLAIPINFVVVFTFSYMFTYNLRTALYFPFAMQYLYLLSTPVSDNKLGIRIISLVVGALLIMAVQLLANKNKLSISGNKLLAGICGSIQNKVKSVGGVPIKYDSIESIDVSIDNFRAMVYDKRENDYYLNEESKIKLNMSVALENINLILSDEKIKSIDFKILDILEEVMGRAKATLSFNPKKSKAIPKKKYSIDELLSYSQEKGISDILSLQLLQNLIFLDETIDGLNKLDKKHKNVVNKISDKTEVIPKEFMKNIFRSTNSLKYCYAMRMAISITVGYFIIDLFNFHEGRWMLLTVLSLTTPLYETSKSKIVPRILYTFVGSLIIVVVFAIFKNQNVRLILVMLFGYLQSYANQYKYQVLCSTLSAIGTAAVMGNVQGFTGERIGMVIVGTIVAILVNKYLFPYRLKDSNKQLREIYNMSITKMFEEINNLIAGNVRPEVINNLFVITSLVESKSRVNKEIDNNKSYSDIVNERRILVSNIYELYRWIHKCSINHKDQEKIINDIKILTQYQNEDITSKITSIENSIKENENINTKITLSSIITIIKGLKRLNELNKLSLSIY